MKLASTAIEKVKHRQRRSLSESRHLLMDTVPTISNQSNDTINQHILNSNFKSHNFVLIKRLENMAGERQNLMKKPPKDIIVNVPNEISPGGAKIRFSISHSNSAPENASKQGIQSNDNNLVEICSNKHNDSSNDITIKQSPLVDAYIDSSEFRERQNIQEYVSSSIFNNTTPLSHLKKYTNKSFSSTESSQYFQKPPPKSFSSENIPKKHKRSLRRTSKVNATSWVKEEKNGWMEDPRDNVSVRKCQHKQQKQHEYQRLVFKNGECNVTRANIKKRRQRYMADIFTTLVDIKWRWNLLNFVLAFTLSWLIFALAWWLICFSHGDFDNYGKVGHKPCVEEVYDFTTALLFSIETQQTIGFGSRRTNPHCPEAILLMMCQSCFGVIIQALMTGLVFAKLSRPKKRAETLLFSKNALICKRDDQLCLLFRVGDMRKSHIVEAHVKTIMIKRRLTEEGEIIPLYQYDLVLGENDTEGRLFMVWPLIVEHKIDENSPLWELSADDLKREQFELVVVLEGIVESTGMTTQARTSYLPSEIMWGHRFEKLVTFQPESGQYFIDYSRFHSTAPIDMPKCSAKDMSCQSTFSSESTNGDNDGEEEEVDEDEDKATVSIKSDPLCETTSLSFEGTVISPLQPPPLTQRLLTMQKSTSTNETKHFLNKNEKKDSSKSSLSDKSALNTEPKHETINWLMASVQQQHHQHQTPKHNQHHDQKHHKKPSQQKVHKNSEKINKAHLPHKNYEDLLKRYSVSGVTRKNGVNSVALAAFDLQNDEPLTKSSYNLSNNSSIEPSPFQFV